MYKLIAPGIISVVLLASGCANHLDPETQVEHKVDRKQVSQLLEINTNAGQAINDSVVNINVEQSTKYHVVELEGTTQYDVFTPYQGARELYEVPGGLLLLPVAVVVNVLDFLTLGLIPNSATDSLLDWSFAGMNPFLNIESKGRTERTESKKDMKTLDEKDEVAKEPLANGDLVMNIHQMRYDKKLDSNGKAQIDLLDYSNFDDGIDNVELSAASTNAKADVTLDVSRQLSARLVQASKIYHKYQSEQGPVNLYVNGQPDAAVMADDVMQLSALGFEKVSRKVEQLIRNGLKDEDKPTFVTALNTALAKPLSNQL